jgi:hypothetical protein
MKKGVGYNIDNVVNKENKENTLSMNNAFLTPFSGVVTGVTPKPNRSHDSPGQKAKENDSSPCELTEPTPALSQEEIQRANIQMYDNGENSPQRYKIKVGIDLVDGDRVEFIASLTKDFRNFKKYIPEQCKQTIISLATAFRKDIKSKYQSYPYLGKFHMNQGRGRHVHSQIEPNTFVAIWYDTEDRGWCGELMIHDWTHRFDLFDEYVTDKQKKTGLKCQDNWHNPQHDKRERPLTWAQQRALRQQK